MNKASCLVQRVCFPSPQLVLINVSDHHTRLLACQPENSVTIPRALGLLLGQQDGRKVDISNSFEVCYDVIEDQCVIDTEFAMRRLEQCKRWLTGSKRANMRLCVRATY